MQMGKLGDLFDGADIVWGDSGYSATPETVYTPPAAGVPDASGGFDWNGIIKTVTGAYGAIKTIDAQTQLQDARNAAALQQYRYPYGTTVGANGLQTPYYPPAPNVMSANIGGIPVVALLIGGLAAFVAFNK